MMRNLINLFAIYILFFFTSCKKENEINELELSFLNDTILSYSKKIDKDTINVVRYSLKNNSNKTYLINNLTEQESLTKTAVYNNGINLHVYNHKHNEISYNINKYRYHSEESADCVRFMIENFDLNQRKLGNKNSSRFFGLYERKNIFFIHPNETVFFEYTLNLNKPTFIDGIRQGFVNLDYKNKYYAKLSISSDSSNYKNVLPIDVLKTIEANNVKVYHGIIESKNKVPIKVLE